jgi:YVTN family beta-propeller protein
MVYAYALPGLKLLGGVPVGGRPDWVTFTPDSRRVYVATESTNAVTVVDVPTLKEVTRIKVGPSPKRNITALLP